VKIWCENTNQLRPTTTIDTGSPSLRCSPVDRADVHPHRMRVPKTRRKIPGSIRRIDSM